MCSDVYKTIEIYRLICYNPFRCSRRFNSHLLYQIIQKIPYFILLNIKLNINECFISFGNLSGIWIESSLNPCGYCGLSERSMRRAVCQPNGRENPDTLT